MTFRDRGRFVEGQARAVGLNMVGAPEEGGAPWKSSRDHNKQSFDAYSLPGKSTRYNIRLAPSMSCSVELASWP